MWSRLIVLFTGIALLWPTGASAQEEGQKPSVVVVPARGKGGPNLKGQLKRRVETPLKKRDDIELVALPAYMKAARKARIRGKAAMQVENAAAVGEQAGVSHVAIVESQMERQQDGRRKKRVFFAALSVVDVASGEVVHTSRHELKGRRVTPEIGTAIIDAIAGVVVQPAEPPVAIEEEPEEETEVPAPPTPPAPPEGEPEDTTVASDDAGEAAGEGDAAATEEQTEQAAEVATAQEGASAEEEVEQEAQVETEVVQETTEPTDSEAQSEMIAATSPELGVATVAEADDHGAKPSHSYIEASAGLVLLQRDAQVESSGSPPGYEGPLLGGHLDVELMPLVLAGMTDWWATGLSLQAEADLIRVTTEINDAGDTIDSNVWGMSGGIGFEIPFWMAATAPSFTFEAGYGAFYFPLARGPFPGAQYKGPEVGGVFTIPFIESIALELGAVFTPMLSTAGKLQRLGDKDSGYRLKAEGGVKAFFDPFVFSAMGRFEQFSTSYSGQTALMDTGTQYTDVSLTDRFFGGTVTAGVRF